MPADRAALPALVAHDVERCAEEVDHEEAARKGFAHARGELQGLGRLEDAHDAGHRREDADGGRLEVVRGVVFFKEAAVAGRLVLAHVEDGDLSREAHGRTEDEGLPELRAGGVHRVAGLEVVRAVEHDVGLTHGLQKALALQNERNRADVQSGVEARKRPGGVQRLVHPERVVAVDELAREVGGGDRVGVRHGDAARARGGEVHERGGAQAPRPHDEEMRAGDAVASLGTKFGEKRLSGESFFDEARKRHGVRLPGWGLMK